MATKSAHTKPRPIRAHQPLQVQRRYRGADIPLTAIRRFARQIAEQFDPDKVILFGSYAYGTPHADSDVDILVVMPAKNRIDQAHRIRSTLLPPFPTDLIVRRPEDIADLESAGSFMQEIINEGKVLYERRDAAVGSQSRRRSEDRAKNGHRRRASA
jgi:uncharacterized protein